MLAKAARASGYEVTVLSRVEHGADKITGAGIKLIPIRMKRSGASILGEIAALSEIVRLYRSEKPDIVHHVALKPVVFGSIAARFARVPCQINALAGLGFVFSSIKWKARILRPLIQATLRILLNGPNTRTIVQNRDDRELLIKKEVLGPGNIRLVRGSGVDMSAFKPVEKDNSQPVVILAGRMLWDKGAGEFVHAAIKIKDNGINARFVLVGVGDPDNPSSISDDQLRSWHNKGYVEWWGKRDNMPEVFAKSHIVCSPTTYGEGVPKVLIEAAACGLPIVANDVPGCREIVRHGENGILVQPLDQKALADALVSLLDNKELRESMGRKGREIVEKEFSDQEVIKQTMIIYKELLV